MTKTNATDRWNPASWRVLSSIEQQGHEDKVSLIKSYKKSIEKELEVNIENDSFSVDCYPVTSSHVPGNLRRNSQDHWRQARSRIYLWRGQGSHCVCLPLKLMFALLQTSHVTSLIIGNKVFYHKMKGDYLRYLAEFQVRCSFLASLCIPQSLTIGSSQVERRKKCTYGNDYTPTVGCFCLWSRLFELPSSLFRRRICGRSRRRRPALLTTPPARFFVVRCSLFVVDDAACGCLMFVIVEEWCSMWNLSMLRAAVSVLDVAAFFAFSSNHQHVIIL